MVECFTRNFPCQAPIAAIVRHDVPAGWDRAAVRCGRVAGPLLNYLHVGESNRGFLGTGRVDLGELFDATVDTGFDGFVTFEAFSLGLCNQRLVDACAVWRDTWSGSRAIASHAKATIEAAHRDALGRSQTANALS